jgi:hypothetical protein
MPPPPASSLLLPGVLTETTAELALALTFSAARRVVEGDKFMRAGLYKGWLPTLFVGNLLQVRQAGSPPHPTPGCQPRSMRRAACRPAGGAVCSVCSNSVQHSPCPYGRHVLAWQALGSALASRTYVCACACACDKRPDSGLWVQRIPGTPAP